MRTRCAWSRHGNRQKIGEIDLSSDCSLRVKRGVPCWRGVPWRGVPWRGVPWRGVPARGSGAGFRPLLLVVHVYSCTHRFCALSELSRLYFMSSQLAWGCAPVRGGNECQRRIKIYQNYAFCARPYGHMAKSYLKRNGNFTFPSIFALPEITFSLTQPHMRGLGRTRSQQHYFSF